MTKICPLGRRGTFWHLFLQKSAVTKIKNWNSPWFFEKYTLCLKMTEIYEALMDFHMKIFFFFPRTDTPEAPIITGMLVATEGQIVSMNCSVNYHCPSRPPALQWILERGDQHNITKTVAIQTVFAEPNKPVLLASLSFTVLDQVKPRLRCEASYPGAIALATSKELHVTCEQILSIDSIYVLKLPCFHLFFFAFQFRPKMWWFRFSPW